MTGTTSKRKPLLVMILKVLLPLALAPSSHAFLAPTIVLNKILRRGAILRKVHSPFEIQNIPSLPDNSASPFNSTATSTAAEAKENQGRQKNSQQQALTEEQLLEVAEPPDLDAMRARAGVLRRSILQQQLELQQLERQIICCSSSSGNGNSNSNSIWSASSWNRTLTTFFSSTDVLKRKLHRVQSKIGVNNQQWNSVGDFVVAQTSSGVRIVDGLWRNPRRLQHMWDPETLSLTPHVPAIWARMDKLEPHVEKILERVLNNQRHLASVEPYLPQILDRFDDIEPHLNWILEHLDVLAPNTGLLLKHIDELLPYASLDEHESNVENGTQYALAEQLLPYLEFYVSRLDTVGPHLPLLRPHVPKLLKHNRIAKMSPHIDRLFALGYKDNLGASANMDVLLFWFGWALRVPGLPRLFFAIPGSPRIVTFLANRLPKRFVRGYCSGVSCYVDGDYGGNWNKLSK